MKSILLYANQDQQLQSRLQAAMDVTRLFQGHLNCVQATPFDSFIMGDPFGGIYALPSVVEQVAKAEAQHRASTEAVLRDAAIDWSWARFDGAPDQVIMKRASLADLVVLSLPDAEQPDYERTLDIIGGVAVTVQAPVIGVPASATGFSGTGAALVAWNGSAEAAHALRLSLPFLRNASRVHLVNIAGEDKGVSIADACDYLVQHAVAAERHLFPREEGDPAEALLAAADRLEASFIVLGAYGHSRFREAVLGGTTRRMLCRSSVPLVLAH